MTKRYLVPFFVVALALVALGCSTDNIDDTEGTSFLVVSDFDGLPLSVSVNQTAATGGLVLAGEFDIDNVPKNSAGSTSPIMDVQISTYQVTYTRLDTGSRTPPTLNSAILGLAPIGGSLTIENLPIVTSDQVTNVPLSDLLLENGGFDKETGTDVIPIELQIQFFGRSISGDSLATTPVAWRIEFRP